MSPTAVNRPAQSSPLTGVPREASVISVASSQLRRGASISFVQATTSSLVRVSLLKGHMFLPLCAKPAMLSLIEKHPELVESYIRQCLDAGEAEGGMDAKLVIMIADGGVMAEAEIAIGKSKGKAYRAVDAISKKLRSLVDAAVDKICSTSPEHRSRIMGCVHWSDVESGPIFKKTYAKMVEIMQLDLEVNGQFPVTATENIADGLKAIQFHIKTLVKNLFTQRVRKANAAGLNITNVFEEDTLNLVRGEKCKARYEALLKACLLEMSCIIVGIEWKGLLFTEMQYMNNDAQGMTLIAKGLTGVRGALFEMPPNPFIVDLKILAGQTHGIELLNYCEVPENDSDSELEFPAVTVEAGVDRSAMTSIKEFEENEAVSRETNQASSILSWLASVWA